MPREHRLRILDHEGLIAPRDVADPLGRINGGDSYIMALTGPTNTIGYPVLIDPYNGEMIGYSGVGFPYMYDVRQIHLNMVEGPSSRLFANLFLSDRMYIGKFSGIWLDSMRVEPALQSPFMYYKALDLTPVRSNSLVSRRASSSIVSATIPSLTAKISASQGPSVLAPLSSWRQSLLSYLADWYYEDNPMSSIHNDCRLPRRKLWDPHVQSYIPSLSHSHNLTESHRLNYRYIFEEVAHEYGHLSSLDHFYAEGAFITQQHTRLTPISELHTQPFMLHLTRDSDLIPARELYQEVRDALEDADPDDLDEDTEDMFDQVVFGPTEVAPPSSETISIRRSNDPGSVAPRIAGPRLSSTSNQIPLDRVVPRYDWLDRYTEEIFNGTDGD